MAILTTRQKQYLVGHLLLALLVTAALGAVWSFYTAFPLVAWPLTAALVGGAVWLYVKALRRQRMRAAGKS